LKTIVRTNITEAFSRIPLQLPHTRVQGLVGVS
jgi:hypothetical protein